MVDNIYTLIKSKKMLYPRLEKSLFNSYYSLSELGDFNPYSPVILCPFHDDRNKPSAKFYQDDEDGIQKIWCFVCRKQYTAYDYVKLILHQDPILMLTKEIPEQELILAVNDYIANAGKLEMRKSKIDDEVIKTMNEKDFIKYICMGDYNIDSIQVK